MPLRWRWTTRTPFCIICEAERAGIDPRWREALLHRLQQVGPADVRAAAQRSLHPDRLATVIVADSKDSKHVTLLGDAR